MLAQHCFVMCPLPQFKQTVRCGTSRQLATDTRERRLCTGACFFLLCGERELANRDPHSKFPPRWFSSSRGCASGSLRDGQAVCQNTPTDLKHTHSPSRNKKTRLDTTQGDGQHCTVNTPPSLTGALQICPRHVRLFGSSLVTSFIHESATTQCTVLARATRTPVCTWAQRRGF